ncbi:MAG TPA: Clp protease N-terminal domain-containing protein [Candidatus Nanoarchaeia archaeon]|nr:Clp protease N-terminal domain-containing protein [Candidatus Nanoarchaeia archaeon]
MSHATTMATELGHPAIESEHVLLGIAFVAGPGQSILRSMGLEYDPLEVRVRSRLCARHLGDVEREPIPGAQLRRIMKYAKTEAADSDSR